MAAFGADEETIGAWRANRQQEPERIEIVPEIEAAARLFLACATQWRAGVGGLIGLDYTAVAAVADILKIPLDSARFADLRTMENAALEAFAGD